MDFRGLAIRVSGGDALAEGFQVEQVQRHRFERTWGGILASTLLLTWSPFRRFRAARPSARRSRRIVLPATAAGRSSRQSRPFLRIGMMAVAFRSRMAVWQRRVSQAPSAVTEPICPSSGIWSSRAGRVGLSPSLLVSTAEQERAKGQRKMLPLWVWHECRMSVRQHPGDRACHRVGGGPDALARQGQRGGLRGGRSCLVLACLALAEAIAVAVPTRGLNIQQTTVKYQCFLLQWSAQHLHRYGRSMT